MANKKLSKNDLTKLLSEWDQEFETFVPSQSEGIAKFTKWDGRDVGFLDWYRNTTVPPKTIFFPPVEEMFSFNKDKQNYRIELPPPSAQKQIIFGIRPCDAKALTILDKVFADAYEDPYYLDKRRNVVLVSLACTRPYDSCFCTSLGSDPTDFTNADLMLIDIGDEFLVEAVTDKGKALISQSQVLATATKADETKVKKVKQASLNKISRNLDTKDINKRLLASFEDHDLWQEIAAKCISCGICTLLCPTCYCFDINDELIRDRGTRFRSWDSCGFPTYTKMPVENPREDKWRRVRNKVCHKYEFYPLNFEVIACTGCGRCIRQCPVNWDITKTLEKIPAAPLK